MDITEYIAELGRQDRTLREQSIDQFLRYIMPTGRVAAKDLEMTESDVLYVAGALTAMGIITPENINGELFYVMPNWREIDPNTIKAMLLGQPQEHFTH